MERLAPTEAAAPETSAIWTVAKVLRWSTTYLKEKGSASAQLDAEILLAQALRCQRIDLYLQREKPLSVEERTLYREYVARRARGEPVSYITGRRGFWRFDFNVSSDVLIPRPETELLVDLCLQRIKNADLKALRVLDVGTGSGCIGISIAADAPGTQVVAWDVSAPALAMAEKNARELGVENIEFAKVDALNPFSWCEKETFDIIVANPPYIAEFEEDQVDMSVRNFEPRLALFADAGGLRFFQQFAEQAGKMLRPGGVLLMEVGMGQAEKVCDLFRPPSWNDISTSKDLAGIDRVVTAVKSA